MVVTLFKNIHSTSTPYHLKIEDILHRIKTGASKNLISKIRKETDKSKRNELKKNLPSICFSGTFRERKANKLIKHSGLITLDFDEFKTTKQMLKYKQSFIEDAYTYAVFISPSGKGLKVLIKIPPLAYNHKKYFEALKDYYKTSHFDISGSDVSRVCYESFDEKIHINTNSDIFDKIIETKELSLYDTNNVKIPIKQESEIVRRLEKWWNDKYGLNEGQRNENIFKLACAFSEFGINQYSCEQNFFKYVKDDFSHTEIKRTIQSAYQKTKSNFDSKYFEDNQITDYVNRQVTTGINDDTIRKELKQKGYKDYQIDATIETAKENESIDVYWSKTEKGRVTIISKKFKEYLKQKGFYKYYPIGSENFVFVKIESNLIENTTSDKIKTFVLNELSENENFDVFEYLAVNTRFFKDDYLNILEDVKILIKSDTKDTSYCYFNNCAVQVKSNKIDTIDYISLDGYVWKDQVIDREFKQLPKYDNDFKTFLFNISGQNDKNLKAFETTLGYLMTSYKNKGYAPAIILNDEVISENPEGGTGKGLIVDALTHLKRVVILDGQKFDNKKSFEYSRVSASTQILVYDDVKKKFNFQELFSLITAGVTLEKKNKDAIKLDFYNSPKIIISTNYAISGKGNSHDRRRQEVELAQFYNPQKTPLDEFGKLLFDDWNTEEWLRFDNYMIANLQKFIKNGFTKAEFKNLEVRKFINESSFEFYEWIEETDNLLIRQVRASKNELFEDFINQYTDYKRYLTKKRFNIWLKAWAKHKNIKTDEGNSNGIRWITFLFKEEESNVLQEILF